MSAYLNRPLRDFDEALLAIRGVRVEYIDSYDCEGFVVTLGDDVISPLFSTKPAAEEAAISLRLPVGR